MNIFRIVVETVQTPLEEDVTTVAAWRADREREGGGMDEDDEGPPPIRFVNVTTYTIDVTELR